MAGEKYENDGASLDDFPIDTARLRGWWSWPPTREPRGGDARGGCEKGAGGRAWPVVVGMEPARAPSLDSQGSRGRESPRSRIGRRARGWVHIPRPRVVSYFCAGSASLFQMS
jgi:hypothetical protein